MILETVKGKIEQRIREEGLWDKRVLLRAKALSAQESIGNPEKYDYPLLKGREKIIEALFEGYRGHAFTDMYGGFSGTLNEVLSMALTNNYRRALFVSTINALCSYWKLISGAVHCKDEYPRKCAQRVAGFIADNHPGTGRITLIGYQPAMADLLSKIYEIKILDLDKNNIGQKKFGAVILDGRDEIHGAVQWADLVLATGTVVVNGTITTILAAVPREKLIFYGVTIAGVAHIYGLKRICFALEAPSVAGAGM